MKKLKWRIRAKFPDGKLLGEGKLSREELDRLIENYGQKAKDKMEETKADHVLYAIKKTGSFSKLVTLYCQPLTEEEFIKYFSKQGKRMIYAVHNPNPKRMKETAKDK